MNETPRFLVTHDRLNRLNRQLQVRRFAGGWAQGAGKGVGARTPGARRGSPVIVAALTQSPRVVCQVNGCLF